MKRNAVEKGAELTSQWLEYQVANSNIPGGIQVAILHDTGNTVSFVRNDAGNVTHMISAEGLPWITEDRYEQAFRGVVKKLPDTSR